MHRYRSAHTLKSLRAGAWHFLINVILGITGLGLLGYGYYSQDQFWVLIGAYTLGIWILSIGLFFIQRSSLRCPLCMTSVWRGNKCQRHRKVKPALGVSYRLGLATSVIFLGRYRCQYCGEPFNARESRKAK